uniref:Uncharacterized protein n=1 Tax=Lactuca sativa TaxID=4236 RepID=A0A9R1XCE1_LACSA|nr:hypothetical protein LSAT_V11C500276070 [Lactuca sativa]
MGAGGLASIVFGLIADAFGGTSFIAIGTIAFSIAGAGGNDATLMSTAVRFPAQQGYDLEIRDGGRRAEEAASTPAVSRRSTAQQGAGGSKPSVFSFVLLSMGAGGLASIVFGLIADAFGGTSFIAISTIAFSIAGAGGDDDTVMFTAVRFPAQAICAAGGIMYLLDFMPLEYKHLLEGPTLKVDLHTGAIAEGVLTFVITFVVLFIIIKGPNSLFLKNWMLSMATMVMILVSSSYTGPSMNPAN